MKSITSEHTLLKLKVKTLIAMGIKLDAISKGISVNGTSLYKWMRGERNLNNDTAAKVEQWIQDFAARACELANPKEKVDE